MSYKLRFHEQAWREWNQLDGSIKAPLRKKLLERLEQPHVPAPALRHMPNCYKIKLTQLGYRLVYRVEEDMVVVTVIAIGRRDKSVVHDVAARRL